MRILIVSDVHANLVALETVLKDAERGGAIDGVWSLGDSVGYGPQPSRCVAHLREMGAVMVAGNHERAATGAISTQEFNRDAAMAAQWTKQRLTAEERGFLDSLPEVAREGEFTLVHGSLRDPIWEYMDAYYVALGHFALQESPYSLFGHTHLPRVVVEDPKSPHGCEFYKFEDGMELALTGETRLAVNPGSVGQPRDHDPRASYAVYDVERAVITLHRTDYDIGATQRLMMEAGLPRWLIERLAEGR